MSAASVTSAGGASPGRTKSSAITMPGTALRPPNAKGDYCAPPRRRHASAQTARRIPASRSGTRAEGAVAPQRSSQTWSSRRKASGASMATHPSSPATSCGRWLARSRTAPDSPRSIPIPRHRLTGHERRPHRRPTEKQLRTVSAWGPIAQQQLARLRIGVVGAGSVGALVAEALARTGMTELVLIDFGSVELHNLDRLLDAAPTDVRLDGSKVEALARGLRRSATAARGKDRDARAQRRRGRGMARCARRRRHLLLRRSTLAEPRSTSPPSLTSSPWSTEASPSTSHTGAFVARTGRRASRRHRGAASSAPASTTRGLFRQSARVIFEDPAYIRGLPSDHPLRRNEDVFALSAAVASLEVLQFLSMVLAPNDIADVGAHNQHFVTGRLDGDQRSC